MDARSASVADSTEAVELTFWQSVQASDDPVEYRAYLARFPEGAFTALAHARLASSSNLGQSSADRTVELAFWDSIKDAELPEMFEAYLEKYPDGEFRALAELRMAALRDG
jgi:hypothetical protein